MPITSPNQSMIITPTGGVLESRTPSGGGTVEPGAIYVSLSGNDSNAGTIGSPYRTPSVAVSRLVTGQTLYFRAGTYDIPTPGGNRACGLTPPAANCTMSAYPGETVTLRGGYSGNYGVFPTGGTIGTGSRAGTQIIGFIIKGMVMFDGTPSGSRPSMIKDCDISIGGDGWPGTNQGGVVWIDDANDIQLINCVLHDNGQGAQSNGLGNDGLIMGYDLHGGLIQQCTFRNSSGTAMTFKDDVENLVVERCFYDHIAASGLSTGNNTAARYTTSITIRNCIFRDVNYAGGVEWGGCSFLTETSQCYIHNNVFHACGGGDLTQWVGGTSVPYEWFNNLHNNSSRYINYPYSTSDCTATAMDFNRYYGSASPKWVYRNTTATTLATWRTTIGAVLPGAENNSDTNNPNFTNGSGNFTSPTDFKRTAYPQDGRGGAWPAVRGAYQTGNEIIGSTLP